MKDTLPQLPQIDYRKALAIVGIVCLFLIPTGAVVFNELDLIGPDEEIALQPYDGPNGEYAQIDAERQLTINVTDAGVNPDAVTDIKRVFTITNVGDDDNQVWITHTNDHAVTFYDDSSGNPITEADNLTLDADEKVVVSIRIDTTDSTVNAGATLLTKLYVHTRTYESARPVVESPGPISFENVAVGSSSTTAVQILNTGNATLELSNFTLSGADASAFEIVDAGSSLDVQPGQTSSFTLRFSPTTPGAKTATLAVETNDPDVPTLSLDVSGTGFVRNLTIADGSAIDFGSVETGTTATGSVSVRNDGGQPITLQAASIDGTGSGDFDAATDEFPVELAPGETHEVGVSFTPTTTGPASATLVVAGGEDGNETVEAELAGTGVAAAITVDPSTIDFGEIGKGNTTNVSLSIESTGTRPLSVDDLGFVGANPDQFAVDADWVPATLAPGETANVTVSFEPTEAGNLSASLVIETNATGAPTTTVPVAGESLPPQIGTGDDNLDFGNVTVGASKTLNVTVWNEENSPADLHVTDTFIVGANPEAFNLTGGKAPFTLAPGEERDVQVTYNPETPGIKTAQLRILSDAGNSPQIDVWMSNAGWRIRVQQVAPRSRGVDGDEEEWSMDPATVNDDSTRVEVDADDIPEGMWLDVNVSQPSTRSSPAGTDEIRLRVEREGSFDMNFVHAKTPPTTDAVTYSPADDQEIVQYITLWHSIPNEDFSSPTLTYRVNKGSLPADATLEDIVFWRYADGAWTSYDATLVRETVHHYVYRVDLPGLSQFVITAPNGTGAGETPGDDDEDGASGGDDDDSDDDTGPNEEDDEQSGQTVEKGDTSITFENGSDDGLPDSVTVQDLPVPTPGQDGRDGPDAAITSGDQGAGENGQSIESGNSDVSLRISTDERAIERINAKGADAMAIIDEPIPLTASHSLFRSKDSIDDDWRMIRQLEITVPPEYEDSPATIQIRVPHSRFGDTDPENATIARQHEGWQLLGTRVVDRTADAVVLEADTPGFSVFAIFANNDVSYAWEVDTYEDPLSGQTIEPTFEEIGIFNVSLTVTDSFGLTDTARYRIMANDVPAVEIERAGPLVPNESATLVANVADEYGNVTINWTFPDGSEATGRTVEYTFESGTQPVSVVVTDEFGARGTAERRFTVGGPFSGVDSLVHTVSPEGTALLSILLLVILAILARRWWPIAALSLGHAPEISVFADPVLDLANRRVRIPTLQIVDRGGDLREFEMTVFTDGEELLATGIGSIGGGREFEASSVELTAYPDEWLARRETYVVEILASDESGNETARRKTVSVDSFVYPLDD